MTTTAQEAGLHTDFGSNDMNTNQYLQEILADQRLSSDSDAMTALREHRDAVEGLLKRTFGNSSPTIRYGGSFAKGTLIRESYDLDLVCYFPSGETGAGDTLADIFDSVRTALAEAYYVDPKTSALRLAAKDAHWVDFHIDVVPGRFTDDTGTDCYLYQNGAEKCRLKTNLDIHIGHIRDAGVTPALRLLKLWRARRAITMKNFVWELLCIKLLDGFEGRSLEDQLEHVLRSVAEADEAISVKDPANPEGNDLMEFLKGQWWTLRPAAQATMSQVDFGGWEAVFGPAENVSEEAKSSRLAAVAASVSSPTPPWLG